MVDSKKAVKSGLWLVKSGDRILGPYSTDDLGQLIREKEVVVIDEIMAPQSRWAYVRDVETFKPVVEEIRRGLMHSREDTEVQGYTSGASRIEPTAKSSLEPTAKANKSSGQSPIRSDGDATYVTQTLTATTPDIGVVSVLKSAPAASAGPAVPTSKGTPTSKPTPVSKTAPVPKATIPIPPKSNLGTNVAANLAMEPLPHHNSEAAKEAAAAALTASASKAYRRPGIIGGQASLIFGSIVLILAAGFIIVTVLRSPQVGKVSAGSDNLQTQASVAWKRGEFEKALEYYRALNHNQPGQPLIAARLATLMMKIEGQTVEAKRVIESAQANAKDDEDKSALTIARGLAALQNDDPNQAALDFESAGSSWIASFDKGVALTSSKKWTEAAKAFEGAGDNAISLFMLARTHLNSGEQGSAKIAARRQADEAIKKALVQAPDYQQESLLLAAYIDAVSGNTKRANREVLEALDTDPNQTTDHFHDPSLSLDQVAWSKLMPYCQGLNKELASRVSGAMLSVCLAKSNQLEDATKQIDAELGKENGNPHLHAVKAYLYTLGDREDAARASLTLSVKNGNSRLAQILSARLCMREKQDKCAEETWAKLASETNPPIAAITSLAQLREQKGDTAAASALLVKADSMSPKYLPLLRLREDASR